MELVVRTLYQITLCVLLAVFVLGDSENMLEELKTQSVERMQQDNVTPRTSTITIGISNTTLTSFSSSNSNKTISSSTRSSSSSSSNSNTLSTTKATNFANHQSTKSTSTERSIEPGSDIARNIAPGVTSATSTTVKPSPKRQISLAEFQKLVAKVNDEIQLLRNQSNNLSRTYDDLVQRYNKRISQMSIQVDDSTPGTTPGQIITTTVVPAIPLADNQHPPLMADDDHQQPSYLTKIYGNNYYNYIHYYMYPPTDDQMNVQQGRMRGGSIDHQPTPVGRHPEPDNEQDQRYDSADSSDNWQPASFHPRNPASLSEPDVPPSGATLPPLQPSPQPLDEFLARHKITLDPVVLATSPPIPVTTTPIPLEKVLTVEHPPYLVLTIPTTAKPVPGNPRNGWDGFDFQFVRKAIESKKRAEADGVTEVFE